MAGHSRSKNGVASLAYVLAIHVLATQQDVDARLRGHDEKCKKDADGRDKPGHPAMTGKRLLHQGYVGVGTQWQCGEPSQLTIGPQTHFF
jgi:hypothetical protein